MIEVQFENNLKPSAVVRPSDVETIKCSNCEKALAHINIMKLSKDSFYKVVIRCPFCGDKSFAKEINGKLNIHTANGVVLTNVERDESTLTTIYKTEKSK